MRNIFKWGGVAASVILIAFGAGSIAIGAWGIDSVRDNLKDEYIVGSPDMTTSQIKADAAEAGLTNVNLPDCSVAGETIDTGSESRCFGQYMRIHVLESTGGYTYSQMGRFEAKPDAPKSALAEGGGTDDAKYAVLDPKTQQPVSNGARNLWVTYTALSNALNTAFFAERVGLFGIVMGIALLLTGIGFLVLVLGGLERKPAAETAPSPATAKT
jgi:hypothetical protein